jgi:hypothetical protein
LLDTDALSQIPLDAGASRLLEAFGGGFSGIDRLICLSAGEKANMG